MTENENVVRPQIIDLDKAVSGRYVRLHVTESGYLESQGNISQIGEISAYGIYNSNAAVINKTALRMNPGDEDYLKFTYYGAGNLNLTFRSENTSVATISPEGKVVAVAEGSTKLVVDDAATGGHWEVSVLVDNYKPTENLMITAFWPIQKANMTKEYLDDKNAVSLELLPVQGQTMSLADIERRLAQLDEQFQQLLTEAIDAEDKEACNAQFAEILAEQTSLKKQKEAILQSSVDTDRVCTRMKQAEQAIENAAPTLTEWNENAVRQIVERVTVLSTDEILVQIKGGAEIKQTINR